MLFYETQITGNLLPDKTLCLTYDDGPGLTQTPTGPGPRTDDLAFYLFLQGIPATFFVMGDHAVNEPELCEQLMLWGHLVVNHTKTHYGLPWQSPTDMIADVNIGAANIGAAANPYSLLLRPPYGAWSNDVATTLNADSDARKFTGPIMLDIGAYDWQFWENQNLNPVQQLSACFTKYYDDITLAGCGIVDFHDSSQDPSEAPKNQTFELTRLLIPQLIADGYRFVRLDAVPQVRSAMLVNSIIGLKASNGFYVSPQGGGGASIMVNGPALSAWEELGVVQLANGQQAFRTPNGQYISAQPTGEILANGNGPYVWEAFNVLSQGSSLVKLRAWNGNYVTVPTTGPYAGQMAATATGIAQGEIFTLEVIA